MAVKLIKNVKDTYVNSLNADSNYGIDEILELEVNSNISTLSRILIEFDSNEIAELKSNFNGDNSDLYLKLFLASAQNLPDKYSIELYDIDSGWENGVGKFYTNYNQSIGINYSEYISTLFPSKVKLSEQEFDIYSNKDISFNLSGSTTYSYQLNVKNDTQTSNEVAMKLQYFSRDTNTIFSPQLHYKFEDSEYTIPMSGSVINSFFTISMKNNVENFYSFSKYRLNISARDMNPLRIFSKNGVFSSKKYLPVTSYYAIRDISSNFYLIEYDDIYTKISLDSEGNFFTLYTENMETNRYYAVDIKVVINGNEYIKKDNLIFMLHDNDNSKYNNHNIAYS